MKCPGVMGRPLEGVASELSQELTRSRPRRALLVAEGCGDRGQAGMRADAHAGCCGWCPDLSGVGEEGWPRSRRGASSASHVI